MNWIKASDQLPDKNVDDFMFFTTIDDALRIGNYYRSSNNEWITSECCCNEHFTTDQVTHWMPLPEKPHEPIPEKPCKKHPKGHKDVAQAFGCSKPMLVPLSIFEKEQE